MEDMPEAQVIDPYNGSIAFGSAYFGWAFTIQRFADVYAKKYGVDRAVMMVRLWGDNYFDAKAMKWKNYDTPDEEGGKKLKRAFVNFIMEPKE